LIELRNFVRHAEADHLTFDFRILVQDHVQQRTMDLYAAVVINKA
jgi:hypothetical protein